ncbi:hypothetical protein [Treponema endosymbiont of Eucomonympha sp.]|uniref:hypothetical protein n=1 Tax=Treponema endosymbiont of Eucomonympha sp. TaxID=1580831 RepID=UPI0007512956|nr:hypothetical protein [Treponema endosymbiont of Eucomonympha sp.]
MTEFKKAAINAAALIAVAATAGASILGCDGFANEPNESGAGTAAGPERKAAAARFGDGDYTFYFKNGATASGDCDGYSSEYGGKTTIYEWWRDDIRKWETRIKAAGANIETNSDKYHSGYYWVSFDTNLIYGTGLHELRNWSIKTEPTGAAYLRIDGKETKIVGTNDFRYAQAGGDFNWQSKKIKRFGRENLSEVQKSRDVSGLGIVFLQASNGKKMNSVKERGYSVKTVKENEAYLIDASTIEWFAYDDEG